MAGIPRDEQVCLAGSTPHITFTLRNHSGTAIPLTSISALTLTLWDQDTSIKIRDGQSVLNANNVTVNATSGAVDWHVQTTDTALVSPDPNIPQETRRFLFTFTWTESSETFVGYGESLFRIRNPYAGIY